MDLVRPKLFRTISVSPNPFKDNTEIRYAINSPTHVQLSIYDQSGRQLKILINKIQMKGNFVARWNGADRQGNKLPRGVYFAVLKANSNKYIKKLVKAI